MLVTAELDEANNSLQIKAALKNNPNITVSSSFSRGKIDEKICDDVQEIIQELNTEGALTAVGVEKVNNIAAEIVTLANEIKAQEDKGIHRQDLIQKAEQKSRELRAFASEDLDEANFFVANFEFVIEQCSGLISEAQTLRYRALIKDLESAITSQNPQELKRVNKTAQEEYDQLPDVVNMIILCRAGIGKAYRTNPTDANVMAQRLSSFIEAMEAGNGTRAQQIFEQLLPDVQKYLDQKSVNYSVATGITR